MDARVLRWYRPGGLPGALAKIGAPWADLTEAARSLARNVWRFVRSDLHYFAGMNNLFRAFYRAISEGGESPTPPADVRRVTAIMDDIFERCRESATTDRTPAGVAR